MRKSPPEKKSGFKAWQLRAGRAAADISIQRLADLSSVSVSSIRRAEAGGADAMSRVNQKALTDALAALGVSLSAPDAAVATVTMAETVVRDEAWRDATPMAAIETTPSAPASASASASARTTSTTTKASPKAAGRARKA